MHHDAAIELFRDQFGSEPTVLARAPGRVNLIGEHTDYNEGFVFPAAIDRETWVAASISDVYKTRCVSLQTGPGQEFVVDRIEPGKIQSWSKYIAGMAWAFRERGLDVPDLNVAITSNIPMGSGVSSSAALEMAIGRAWLGLLDMDMEFRELARCGQRCENGFVGVQSGIMDQLASAGGQAGHALFIDTRSLEVDPVPIPSEWEIVLLDTGKARALTKSAYNERRNSCEFVAKLLGKPSLRDVALQELDSVREIAGENYPRARHVITENERALTFRTALRQGNAVMVGELMRGSHESLREDYEVSCEELDVMASLAWESQSCIGARLTGAGFGGACVALVSAGEGEEFCADILSRYRHQIGDVRGLKPSALLCSASNGANVTLLSDI